MHRLLQISDALAATLKAQTEFEIRLKNQKLDLSARQLALTPVEGWEGKNAEMRELAQKRTYANDEICRRIEAEINGYEEELARLENCIADLTNERRALEWTIRAHLVEALTSRVITVLESRENVEDTAFDDYADEVADARLEEKVGENGHFDEPFPPEDDLVYLTASGPGGTLLELPIPAGIAEEEDIPW